MSQPAVRQRTIKSLKSSKQQHLSLAAVPLERAETANCARASESRRLRCVLDMLVADWPISPASQKSAYQATLFPSAIDDKELK
jgi:predicted component of type VI protein secretion system